MIGTIGQIIYADCANYYKYLEGLIGVKEECECCSY